MGTAAVAAVGLAVVGAGTMRVEVAGGSMAPTLLPGDRLLVLRRKRARPGQVVAARDPRAPGRPIVKRVVGVAPGGSLVLAGDDPAASTDSRTFGPVPPHLVLGRAVWRYAPATRRGRPV